MSLGAWTANTLWLATVDGWQSGSIGLTAAELGGFLAARGAAWAMALDGGSSAAMVLDGTLVEKPVGSEESLIAVNLTVALVGFARPRKLGLVYGPDATLKMKSGRVRLPDVTFVSREDLPGGVVPNPTFLDALYTYAWFVTFGISFTVYLMLTRRDRSA